MKAVTYAVSSQLVMAIGYILFNVCANLFVSFLAPFGSDLNLIFMVTSIGGVLFIGPILFFRDRLHELWYQDQLWIRMFSLLLMGGILSALFNPGSIRLSLASMGSFIVSELIDTLIYHLLYAKPNMVKINGSNLASSVVDSLLFPVLAFGSINSLLFIGQFIGKFIGGFVCSKLLKG